MRREEVGEESTTTLKKEHPLITFFFPLPIFYHFIIVLSARNNRQSSYFFFLLFILIVSAGIVCIVQYWMKCVVKFACNYANNYMLLMTTEMKFEWKWIFFFFVLLHFLLTYQQWQPKKMRRRWRYSVYSWFDDCAITTEYADFSAHDCKWSVDVRRFCPLVFFLLSMFVIGSFFFCLATPAYAMAFHYKILSVGLLCDALFLGICAMSAMEFYRSSLCFQYRFEQVNFSSVFFCCRCELVLP